jgi:hypothetical protein
MTDDGICGARRFENIEDKKVAGSFARNSFNIEGKYFRWLYAL